MNTSFGGSNKGSGAGSRKSKLEIEADELDDMLNDIDGGPKNDSKSKAANAWGDLPSKPSTSLNKKSRVDDDFDVDNLLDDLEEKKGLRPKTAGPGQKNQSLWSAGGGPGGASSRHDDLFGEDLDQLDDLEDTHVKDERTRFSGSKGRMNQRSEE